MSRSSPEAELALAEKRLDEARRRLAESRGRRRDLTLQGNNLGDAIQRELWQAGRDGRAPDIAGQRDRIAEIQAELRDLDRLETGIEQAVTDAANAVQAVRFSFAPHFQEKLIAEAEKLAAERAQLEQVLAALASREEGVRSGWRLVASSIPGRDPHDLPFDDGATIPTRRPTEPHAAISNYIPTDDWPSWFVDAVTSAARLYARRQSEEIPA